MDRKQVFSQIAAEAASGEKAFPTHAEVALRVRRALEDPDCPLDTAGKLVQAEPVLAARVVAIANSPVYNRSGREIDDVRQAVMRLGFATVRSLATALVVRQLAGGKNATPQERLLASKLWAHTAQVAALAHVLARRVTQQNAETAMFAGIVHDVGGFYLLSQANRFPGLLEGELSDWVEAGEIEVGRAVLTTLGVPETVMAAVEAMWDGYLAMPPATLGDTLLLAKEISPVVSPLYEMAGEADVKHEASLDVLLGEQALSEILAESQAEVKSLTGALQF